MATPPPAPAPLAPPETAPTESKGRRYYQKLWVPVVILIGLIFGELISYVTTQYSASEYGGFPGPFGFPHFTNDFPDQFHIILTTVSVALLVSLLVVYGRTYVETRANFSLGLVFVLLALLLEALLSYPLLIGFFGRIVFSPGYSSEFADVFTVCAYAVFLYLSLE